MQGLGHRHEHVHALCRRRCAPRDVQAVRYQGVLELQHLLGQTGHAAVHVTRVGGVPQGLRIGQLQLGRLGLQQCGQFGTLTSPRHQAAEAVE